MKTFLIIIVSLSLLSLASFFAVSKYDLKTFSPKERDTSLLEDSMNHILLRQKARDAFLFCSGKNFNCNYCMLLNLSKHSGKARFYVWNFERNMPTDSGLVSHGCGEGWWGMVNDAREVTFSNESGSHCSSLGKYKIGKRDYS